MTDFADTASIELWHGLHQKGYHGDYASILARNRMSYRPNQDKAARLCRFPFTAEGKVILDIGCGGGWHMADCIANGAKKVYGIEIDPFLLGMAEQSFRELNVSENAYQFLCAVTEDLWTILPQADVIYSVAVFMHMPFQEVEEYFRLIVDKLLPNGVAFLQFYQVDGVTTFRAVADRPTVLIPDAAVDRALDATGLQLVRKDYPRQPDMEPVWTYYTCTLKRHP